MKYFFDTEFLEGTQERPLILKSRLGHWMIGKQKPTIDLISIGIVAEDGREYYAISKDFNLKEAWNRHDVVIDEMSGDMRNKYPKGRKMKVYWLRENVLKPIWRELFFKADSCSGLSNKQTEAFYQEVNAGEYDKYFTYESIKNLLDRFGKTNKEIALEVKRFCCNDDLLIALGKSKRSICSTENQEPFSKNPEFYAYYADYDWVVFCWLFGKMMDLPKGFPMYCKDLKQMLDEKVSIAYSHLRNSNDKGKLSNEFSFEKKLSICQNSDNYPKQENEHDALADARWNKRLFDFLQKI